MIGNALSHLFWPPGGGGGGGGVHSRIPIFATFLVWTSDADWLMAFFIHFLPGCATYVLFLQPVEAGLTSHFALALG